MPLCLCARAPLAPALRGRAATQPCLTVARASPLRVGGGSRRAGAGVRRGEALRLRERAHARVAACRRGWGGRGGLSRPPAFPLPRLERLSARSRHTGSQPTGVLRGHGRGPACPRGALRPGRESPSGSDWADERMGGWRGSRGGSPVVAEGRACDLSALARGLGRAAGGGFVVVRLGGSERRSRASRGRPCVSVAVGSPCLFTRRPVSRSGALPRCPPSAVRAREKERGL